MRTVTRSIAAVTALLVACGPATPEPETVTHEFAGESQVTVTKGEVPPESANGASGASAGDGFAGEVAHATALVPAASPVVGPAEALVPGSTAEAPLPIPTTLATTRHTVFAIGRTRSGYLVRTLSYKAKTPSWSPPAIACPAYDDDAPAFAVNDGEIAWLGVSSPTGGTRVVRLDATSSAPKTKLVTNVPAKLGRVVSFVPLKPHVAVIGKEGDAITFARMDRANGFLDATAKVIAQGKPSTMTTSSRSPRATHEDDKILLAWDADDVPGALEAPGTTQAERASPKPGIYVRRFFANGEPSTPARRLTRPSFEAHALDVVVELGACAVLASTPDGFEMFRFVRKGDDLGPYGGGLHLAGNGGDVALGADVIGTIGVTSSKLLRIGPGIKIVPSPLGFSPPSGGSFDEVRVSLDGYGAHALFGTRTALGTMPTIAKIEGEHMGAVLPTPWIGPPPQRLLLAAADGDEALAIVVDGAAIQAVRLGLDGKAKGTAPMPLDAKQSALLDWWRAPVPRAARAAGEWLVSLKDGRLLFATGPRAGAVIAIPPPKPVLANGLLALVPNNNKAGNARVLWVPPADRAAPLYTATIDPKQGTVGSWQELPNTEHYYGALGGARFTALPRNGGGVYLLTNTGPKVSSVAQIYSLVAVAGDGALLDVSIDAPVPVQEISLVPTMSGAALVAMLTGKGVATRWLDGPTKGWRDAFAYMPFRVKGDGPILREKGASWIIPAGALPLDLGAEVAPYVGDRCPFAMVAGPRSLLLACEEGSGDSPLAARATTRVITF